MTDMPTADHAKKLKTNNRIAYVLKMMEKT